MACSNRPKIQLLTYEQYCKEGKGFLKEFDELHKQELYVSYVHGGGTQGMGSMVAYNDTKGKLEKLKNKADYGL